MNRFRQTFSFKFKLTMVLTLLINLCGCDQAASQMTTKASQANTHAYSTKDQKQLWNRLRRNYHMARTTAKEKASFFNHKPLDQTQGNTSNHQKVQKYVQLYTHKPKTLNKIAAQASPYLYYIVEQLEKRNMPGELALLPIIESSFQPQATSHRGAAGIWQFIPSTGRLYGLKQDKWYDGRRDIMASTKAALDYLQFLHKEFDNNWMLALAAYNSGEGTVHRAIKRNQRAGKPTSFWDLNLPKETKEYVPKLLALAEVIGNPEKHDVALPSIENQPYFKLVDPGTHLNFKQAAQLADIDMTKLKQLNAGYRRASTHPKGPQQLLLPVANAEKFEYNLARKDTLIRPKKSKS